MRNPYKPPLTETPTPPAPFPWWVLVLAVFIAALIVIPLAYFIEQRIIYEHTKLYGDSVTVIRKC